jgi:hypothetical protein
LTAQVPPALSEKSLAWAPAKVNCCKLTGPGPWLLRVSVLLAGLPPTVTSPNATLAAAGSHANTGEAVTPMPFKPSKCGAPTALDATLTLPLAAPDAVGVKVTAKLQVALAAKLLPQLCVTAKPALAVMLPKLTVPVPTLLNTVVRKADATPVLWLPNAKLDGAKFSNRVGATTAAPVPLRLKAAAPLLASDVKLRVALRKPTAPGVKVNPTVQLLPTANAPVAEHVPLRVKSVAATPVRLKPLRVSVAAPLLVTVTLCDALTLPKVCGANVSDAAFSEMAGCGMAVPMPFSAMLDGEPLALCVNAKLAVRRPTAVGVNTTFKTQEVLAATEPPATQVVPLAI